jgi:hypothetical protein
MLPDWTATREVIGRQPGHVEQASPHTDETTESSALKYNVRSQHEPTPCPLEKAVSTFKSCDRLSRQPGTEPGTTCAQFAMHTLHRVRL